MNLNSSNSYKFLVYIHTSPEGKRYVGITSQSCQQRWGKDGKGYKNNKHFYAAICKYGWENFTHEVIDSNLSLQDASNLECSLIVKYDTMNPEHGYNQTTGGNWSTPSDAVRAILKEKSTIRWQNAEYRNYMINVLKVGDHLPVHVGPNEKVSQGMKRYYSTHDSHLKGKPLSEEHKEKLRGRPAWNLGLTKETDDRVNSISQTLQGRHFSEDTIERMRKSKQDLYRSGYKPVWIHKDGKETHVNESDVLTYLQDGWELGRFQTKTVYIHRDNESIKVSPDKVDFYISNGWKLGRPESVNQSLKKANQRYIWTYDELEFVNMTDLAQYLDKHGYPGISSSTVQVIASGKLSPKSKYIGLVGKVSKRESK